MKNDKEFTRKTREKKFISRRIKSMFKGSKT